MAQIIVGYTYLVVERSVVMAREGIRPFQRVLMALYLSRPAHRRGGTGVTFSDVSE